MEISELADVNTAKRSYNDIYQLPDPRLYYGGMQNVEYQIPQNAKPIIEFIIYELRRRVKDRPIRVLDVGCSYGVLSSLIKYNLSLDFIYDYYENSDQSLNYNQIPAREYIEFYGLDVSKSAVDYSLQNNLLAFASCENLEKSGKLDGADIPKQCDVIVSTGCYGYITEKTINSILSHFSMPPAPIIVFFVMRPFDYSPAMAEIAQYGYKTTKFASKSFRQRRFYDDSEKEKICSFLSQSEFIKPKDGFPESDGYIYADLYISDHHSTENTGVFDAFDYTMSNGCKELEERYVR